MEKAMYAILALQLFSCCAAWGGGEKVLLEDIKVLTLKHGQMTTGRRSSPVPQMRCVGGSARCEFMPKVAQCYNKGNDGYSVQWECKTDMDNAYRFGDITVSCEGYDYTDDPYVLKGSCGLEYTIDLTKEGMQNSKYSQDQGYGGGQPGGADYGWKPELYKSSNIKNSFVTNLACGAVVVVIVYAIYKTCIAPTTDESRQRSTTNDDYHGRGPGSAPPPPGFRTDYNQGSGTDSGFCGAGADDSCGGTSSANRGTNSTGSSGFSRNAGGFWTGAAAGGLLGYMFGNRNNDGGHYSGTTYRPRPSSSGFSSGYSSGGGGWSGFSSSSSSGSRSASGFGGTSRR